MMRARRTVLACLIAVQVTCVPVPNAGTIQPIVGTTAAKVYQIPQAFKDADLLCVDVNEPGTCATVADVRLFLISRKAMP